MEPRLFVFTRAFRSSRIWTRSHFPALRPRIAQYICRGCQSKFSTSSILRQVKKAVQDAAKNGGSAKDGNKYPAHLVIYNAGDMRSSFVSFFKATAIFQFGLVAVFLSPVLYHNEKQPDPNIRLLQAVGLTVAGAIPFALMSYLTTPFVKRVALQIPAYARQSRAHLLHFSTHMPAETRLEFTTLRAFPYERNTAVFLHELRALEPQWWRFANIERYRSPEWQRHQSQKPLYRKFLDVINEPRFKFYVKEGRNYTIKTSAGPGVWENVAKAISQQTTTAGAGKTRSANTSASAIENAIERNVDKVAVGNERKLRVIRRQTARPKK